MKNSKEKKLLSKIYRLKYIRNIEIPLKTVKYNHIGFYLLIPAEMSSMDCVRQYIPLPCLHQFLSSIAGPAS